MNPNPNQKLTYKISDVLNGAYKLESGAKLEDIAFYVPKRSIVKVQLKTGKDFKPANGYWIKDGAKPINISKFDDGGEIKFSNGGGFGEVAFIIANDYYGNLDLGFNNITINGNGSTTNGIINVNFGTGYVLRLGGQTNEAIIISNAWPNQATNVATARLRPNTKLGLSGRELIFDSSTIRVKKDVEDYPENAYEIIKNIKPVLYWPRSKRDSEDLEDYNSEYVGKLGGFIAEWLDAEPELRRYVAYETTEENPMDPTAIAYDKLVVPLTKAVQILMERVERLESIISGSNN